MMAARLVEVVAVSSSVLAHASLGWKVASAVLPGPAQSRKRTAQAEEVQPVGLAARKPSKRRAGQILAPRVEAAPAGGGKQQEHSQFGPHVGGGGGDGCTGEHLSE